MLTLHKAGLMAALLGATLLGQGPAAAQTSTDGATNVSAPQGAGDAADALSLLDDATLDAMTSPIALYPDTLLGQVLVATTYPLDVLRADRFLSENATMSEDERTAAVNEKDWPDSVKSLAAGFPELIGRMAEHSDWTETMGEALIAQTDDVLISIQRLRAQAQVNGYLEDNAAMSVDTDPETAAISIAATDPNVVYVPEYTNVVYTQPAPSTPYYVYDNDGNDDYWGDALVAGAIIFGSAIIIDNIFDDDWGNGWDNGYWHGNGGGNSIDWDGDVNIDNGINIGNGNGNGIGNGIGNRPEIGNGDTIIGGDKMANIDRSKISGLDRDNLDRDDLDRDSLDRDSLGRGDGAQIGALDQGKLDKARDANFKPSSSDVDAARAKIADKSASGRDVTPLPAAKGNGPSRDYAAAPSTKLGTKATGASAKPKVAAAKPKPPKVSKPSSGSKKAPTARKPSAQAPAYMPQGGSRSGAASARGHASKKGR